MQNLIDDYIIRYAKQGYSLEQLQKHLIENCGKNPMEVMESVERCEELLNAKRVQENPLGKISELIKKTMEIEDKIEQMKTQKCIGKGDIEIMQEKIKELEFFIKALRNDANTMVFSLYSIMKKMDSIYTRRFKKRKEPFPECPSLGVPNG